MTRSHDGVAEGVRDARLIVGVIRRHRGEVTGAAGLPFGHAGQNWNCSRVWRNCVVPTTPNRWSWPTP
jgi:hypothetical protein